MSSAQVGPLNPYVGPRSFQTGERLYGRDRELKELLGLLVAERIVLLYSPSGAGKTSLVQAGIIPRLLDREFSVLPVMRVNLEPPPVAGNRPALDNGGPPPEPNRYIYSLLLSLEGDEDEPPPQPLPPDRLAAMSFDEYLTHREATAENGDLVLIFDQFEEILTVDPTDVAVKHAFFAQVGQALRKPHRWALFSMREDYVAGLDPYLYHLPTRCANTYRLDLLSPAGARQAIRQPAHDVGVEFELAAADRLVEDLRLVLVQRANDSFVPQPGPAIEPVQLQVVCRRLWDQVFGAGRMAGDDRRGDGETGGSGDTIGSGDAQDVTADTQHATRGAQQVAAPVARITLADVAAVGDVGRALADYYAEQVAAVARASGARERTIRDWFGQRLITAQGIRGQVLKGEGQSDGLANDVIRRLIDTYLVRSDRRRGATWFELAHDRLIEPVRSSNAAWREANLSPLQRRAELWESRQRPDGLLFKDADLQAAEQWAAGRADELESWEREFLAACHKLRRDIERERRNQRLIHGLAIIAAVGAVIAIGLAVLAWNARNAAITASNEARARQLVTLSSQARETFPQRALLFAVEASRQTGDRPLPISSAALYHVMATAGGMPLRGHSGQVAVTAFSPDDRWLATGGDDTSVRLWNVADPAAAPRVLAGHTGAITALAFGPDGRLLASASADTSVHLWNTGNAAAAPWVLEGHQAAVVALAFSPDGRLLASASADGTARLWSMADAGAPPRVLEGSGEPLSALALSPDGRLLAAAGLDGIAYLWSLEGGDEPVAVLSDDNAPVDEDPTINRLRFSPDGRQLITVSADARTRVWDVREPAPPVVLEGHASGVTQIALSRSGRFMATGGSDNSAIVWDMSANPPRRVAILGEHTDGLSGLAFTPDERYLLTAALDKTARLWLLASPNAPSLVLRGHERPIRTMALSANGHYLATGGDGELRLWDLARLTALPTLYGQTDVVRAVAFSPDGRTLASGGDDSTAYLWGLAGAGPPTRMANGEGRITAIAFSPDGGSIAIGGDDESVRLWSATDPLTLTRVLAANPGYIAALAFSADGRELTVATWDAAVARWDLASEATAPAVLREPENDVAAVALSAGGSRLAAGLAGGTVRVYDLAQPAAAPVELPGHDAGITALAFDPGGRWLAVGSGDGLVRLWNLAASGASATVLRGHTALVTALAFSDDGRLLASASDDASAQIWQTGDPQAPPITLRGHTESMTALAFSPDARTLATGGLDATVRTWALDIRDLPSRACATAGRNLSWDEWGEAFADEPYRKTCPGLPVHPQLIESAGSLVGTGDIAGALAIEQQVRDLDAAAEIPARTWAAYCRRGALAGFAGRVGPACSQAVAQEADDGVVREARGIARALGGDLGGAAEDLRVYVDWARQRAFNAAEIARYQAWIAALESGRNPFDAETIRALRQ